MEKTTTSSEIEKSLLGVFDSASKLFDEKQFSGNYKQSFIFRCLNVLKGRDKDKFLWEVIRLLNSRDSALAESNNLIFHLRNAATVLDDETFFKHAYSFLLGIMKRPFSNNQFNS
ncbi:MAG: hypothetical protein KDE26_09650 [Bacteroidetes bacterium]|nr:hypothetical protein [Cyclobacteriaceae bacterium]MCB0843503.1 hypothetical protein [Bacteroidota bacterium]MCB9237553.1 hypothetical protein [Flammeovirgaceae bacterium]MCB0500936.1 hypothetical protein [Cyclobacteriaceae bacterium]MCO5270345.1 hypothetical protein [Cyclobacteriaceae bacterium]